MPTLNLRFGWDSMPAIPRMDVARLSRSMTLEWPQPDRLLIRKTR